MTTQQLIKASLQTQKALASEHNITTQELSLLLKHEALLPIIRLQCTEIITKMRLDNV